MKDDVETPQRPPAKRRQLEQALDVWLAVWATDEGLTPSERRRVQDERDRRKQARRDGPARVVGFTGSRAGMTPSQRTAVRELVAEAAEAHHGDCVGADEQFHSACRAARVPVVLHPPSEGGLRAFCKGAVRSEQAKAFLDRDRDIVLASSVVLATPKEPSPPTRLRGSGTWFTIRFARSRGKPLIVVWPDGRIEREAGA